MKNRTWFGFNKTHKRCTKRESKPQKFNNKNVDIKFTAHDAFLEKYA